MDKTLQDAVFSVFYGGIVGDAIGVPYEFQQRGDFHAETMIGYGTYDQPPGTWSDDTSLTLCLIKNNIEAKPFLLSPLYVTSYFYYSLNMQTFLYGT